MKTDWTPKNVLMVAGGIICLLLILPKLGDGLAWVARVVRTTDVAYAAKEKAETVDAKFQQYLANQDANAKAQQAAADALNAYIRQQAQQAPAPAIERYQDPSGRWYCWDGQTSWWADAEGKCE